MRLPGPIYRSVPVISIFLGVAALYFGSEAYYLGRTPLQTGLLYVAGLALIINSILIIRARTSNATRRKLAVIKSK
jgi:uncharacterized membrane protein